MIFRSQPNDFSISAKRFLNRLVSFEACIEGFSVFHPFLYENTKKGLMVKALCSWPSPCLHADAFSRCENILHPFCFDTVIQRLMVKDVVRKGHSPKARPENKSFPGKACAYLFLPVPSGKGRKRSNLNRSWKRMPLPGRTAVP